MFQKLQSKVPRLSKSERKRLLKLTEYEQRARAKGFKHIAGVDEAGRGPLAGPVVAAACMIPEGLLFADVNDSKLLTPNKRAHLYEQLVSHEAVKYGIGIIGPSIIDRINILQATILAMREAVEKLPLQPDFVFIDGLNLTFSHFPSEKVVDGDARVYCVCAASILAKETRDQIMRRYHLEYPDYGFDAHKGYGTPQHLEALRRCGPCPIHRLSFSYHPPE